jgi:hypothetical protein
MRKSASLFTLIVALAFFAGCNQQPNQQSRQVAVAPAEKPRPDVVAVLANATELREEKLFLVTLKFEKEQFTLDLWAHAKNAMAAESRTLIVGEKTFNEYQIGQKVSSKGDGWGFVFNGEIAEYVVRPTDKKIESQYFWSDRSGTQTEISKEQYDEAMQQLRSRGRQLFTVPFAGVARTYVLEKPLAEYQFVDRKPLNRYFVNIRVENSTFTLDLTKHIRNAANTHDITLEVPREAYEKTNDAWNAQLSTGSLIVKGRLSELRGKVTKKWSEVDNGYQLVKTSDGQQFVIPK